MTPVLRDLVEFGHDLVTRATAVQVVPEWTLRQACRNGHLLRVLPEVFVAAELVDRQQEQGLPAISRLDPALGRRAALGPY